MLKVAIAGYEEKVKNYKAVLEHLGTEVIVSLDLDKIKECEYLILPGGGDINPSYYKENINGSNEPDDFLDSRQYDIIEYFVDNNKKIFGICRGLQFLNVYFGGSLYQDLDTKEFHIPLDEEKEIDNKHMVYALGNNFLSELYGNKFKINSWHHQGIKVLGEGFEVLLKSEDGVIEAIKHKEKNIIAMQFHPERMSLNYKKEDIVDGIKIFEYFLNM